jgi:hypothetical protein
VDWTAISNQSYRLQYTPFLESSNWLDVTGDVTAAGNTASKSDSDAAEANRFYRVRVLP